MKKLNLEDTVNLVYYLKCGHKIDQSSTRKDAMDLIRGWWLGIEKAVKNPHSQHWVKEGAFAGGRFSKEDDGSELPLADHYMVLWSEIVAMDIVEINEEAIELEKERLKSQREYNRMVKANADSFKKFLQMMEREMNKGDEWKEGDDQ